MTLFELDLSCTEVDPTITFTLDQVSKDGESSDPARALGCSGRAKRT